MPTLDEESTIWIEQEDLGTERLLTYKNKRYTITIPKKINRHVILRLRGLGKTRKDKTGNLLLHIWLNKGEDIKENLWLSETSARNGVEKKLLFDETQIIMKVPPKSHDGLTIRLKGYGREADFNWRAPFLHRKSGNLLVRLSVYPDTVAPRYGSFDKLSTEAMALEGWVYRKIDLLIKKLGKSYFPDHPIPADEIADSFNERGWRGVFDSLVRHLGLSLCNITSGKSASIALPGSCQKIVTTQNYLQTNSYIITINEQFLQDPFAIAAILAHELCHVIHSEKIDRGSGLGGNAIMPGQPPLEAERTVDLLVFMFKVGEFQLRVARDTRLTLGYFDQEIFERMQVIVSRKLNS